MRSFVRSFASTSSVLADPGTTRLGDMSPVSLLSRLKFSGAATRPSLQCVFINWKASMRERIDRLGWACGWSRMHRSIDVSCGPSSAVMRRGFFSRTILSDPTSPLQSDGQLLGLGYWVPVVIRDDVGQKGLWSDGRFLWTPELSVELGACKFRMSCRLPSWGRKPRSWPSRCGVVKLRHRQIDAFW